MDSAVRKVCAVLQNRRFFRLHPLGRETLRSPVHPLANGSIGTSSPKRTFFSGSCCSRRKRSRQRQIFDAAQPKSPNRSFKPTELGGSEISPSPQHVSTSRERTKPTVMYLERMAAFHPFSDEYHRHMQVRDFLIVASAILSA